MEVKPKVGLDCIHLGMTMDQVRALWGQPESINYFIPIEKRPEDRSVNWVYGNGVELSFDCDDNFLLGCITARNKCASLGGIRIIGATSSEMKLRFPSVVLDDDFEENGQDFVLRELELSFWVIDDVVDSIAIFPEYDESGNVPIWPSNGS